MPRPKVDPKFRKRIAKACAYCRMTKQKCDGFVPCEQCIKHDRSTSCAYSPHEQSLGSRRNRRERIRHTPKTVPQAIRGMEVSAAVSGSLPEVHGTERSTQSYGESTSTNKPQVIVPGLSHVLYDNKGKVGGYIDSSVFQWNLLYK